MSGGVSAAPGSAAGAGEKGAPAASPSSSGSRPSGSSAEAPPASVPAAPSRSWKRPSAVASRSGCSASASAARSESPSSQPPCALRVRPHRGGAGARFGRSRHRPHRAHPIVPAEPLGEAFGQPPGLGVEIHRTGGRSLRRIHDDHQVVDQPEVREHPADRLRRGRGLRQHVLHGGARPQRQRRREPQQHRHHAHRHRPPGPLLRAADQGVEELPHGRSLKRGRGERILGFSLLRAVAWWRAAERGSSV